MTALLTTSGLTAFYGDLQGIAGKQLSDLPGLDAAVEDMCDPSRCLYTEVPGGGR